MEHLQKLKARFHPKRVDDLTEAAKKYMQRSTLELNVFGSRLG